jgi:hypothetical protein
LLKHPAVLHGRLLFQFLKLVHDRSRRNVQELLAIASENIDPRAQGWTKLLPELVHHF